MNDNRSKDERQRAGGSLGKRLLAGACAQAARLGRALLRSGGVVSLLRLIIVAELCLLGTGVVRRLESSYELAMQAAKMQLAVAEAQEAALEAARSGALNIGTVGDSGVDGTAEDELGADAAGSESAPQLRARDLPTIISDLTGDVEIAADMLAASAEEESAQGAAPERSETAEEVDMLIRRGVAAMTAGDMRLCILSLEQASALAPNHPALLYYYGLAYDKLLNPTKAKEYYDKLFRMRDRAGKYFQRASRRLAYGMEQPSAMRGKLSFGPYKVQHTYNAEQGEKVSILLPILLAPGEEIRSDDVYIRVQIFEMVNGRKVAFSRAQPKYNWVNEKQTWENCEEELIVTYEPPTPDEDEYAANADVKYYGFTAVLAYKGEPLDLISTPAALILHEQQLSNPRRGGGGAPGLLPDDGLSPYTEEAVPFSDEFDENAQNYL